MQLGGGGLLTGKGTTFSRAAKRTEQGTRLQPLRERRPAPKPAFRLEPATEGSHENSVIPTEAGANATAKRRNLLSPARADTPVRFEDEPKRAFWQARSYDFNVWTTKKRVEKLRYMHRNPVKRGLVGAPEEWRWSSYRFYFLNEAGPLSVNEGWTEISFRNRVA